MVPVRRLHQVADTSAAADTGGDGEDEAPEQCVAVVVRAFAVVAHDARSAELAVRLRVLERLSEEHKPDDGKEVDDDDAEQHGE